MSDEREAMRVIDLAGEPVAAEGDMAEVVLLLREMSRWLDSRPEPLPELIFALHVTTLNLIARHPRHDQVARTLAAQMTETVEEMAKQRQAIHAAQLLQRLDDVAEIDLERLRRDGDL